MRCQTQSDYRYNCLLRLNVVILFRRLPIVSDYLKTSSVPFSFLLKIYTVWYNAGDLLLRETERRRTPFCFISAGPLSFLFSPSWNNSRCNQHDRSSLVFQLQLCAKARDVYSTFLFHHLATLSRLLSRPPESQWMIHIRRSFIRSLIHFEFPATFKLHPKGIGE
jgi:hypothetical protein